MIDLPKPTVRRLRSLLDRVIDALQRPAVAAIGLLSMLGYAVDGWHGIVIAIAVGLVLAVVIPRLRVRITRWYLLR